MLLLFLVYQQRGHTSNVALATPTTTFAIGFNYQVSMYFSFYVDGMRETDLREDSANFERLVQRLLHRFAHHWGVSL